MSDRNVYEIFIICNILNSKIFIGATKSSLLKKMSSVKQGYLKNGVTNNLTAGFREYDVDAFYIKSLETTNPISKDHLNNILKNYYYKYESIKNGFNKKEDKYT
jgi:hypothetical protein